MNLVPLIVAWTQRRCVDFFQLLHRYRRRIVEGPSFGENRLRFSFFWRRQLEKDASETNPGTL